jgi:hypothetical protein
MSTRGWKKALLTAGLGTAMALGGVLIASTPAEARDDCSNRIQREQRELNRAVQRYGYFSWQANERRREIRRLQSTCGGFGGFFGNRDDRRWRRGDGDNDRDDRTWRQGNGNNNRDNRRWLRGDGDNDRDDRTWRRGDGGNHRDDHRWRHGDGDRDDRGRRDRDHDRDKDRDRDRWHRP